MQSIHQNTGGKQSYCNNASEGLHGSGQRDPQDKLENVAEEKVMFAALLMYDHDKDELLLQIYLLTNFSWKRAQRNIEPSRESVSLAATGLCTLNVS